MGGTRCTSVEALDRFFRTLSEQRNRRKHAPTPRRDPDIVVTPLIGSVLSGPGGYGTDTLASPQRLRAVTVKVTARTEDEDPSVNFVPRASPDAPLDFYQVDPVMEGAARTVTLAARVSFRQFAVRNVL